MANDFKWPDRSKKRPDSDGKQSKYRGRGAKAERNAQFGQITGTRGRAARIIGNVLQGRSLDTELAHQLVGLSNEDQRFLQALTYGVLRELSTLQWLTEQMLDHPPRKEADVIAALLCVGLYQLRSMNQPERAAVHSTVEAAKELNIAWAANLINAVLRRYLRERKKIDAAMPNSATLKYAHPQWLVDQLKADWPAHWQEVLAANQQAGPMWLRVNQQQQSRDEYLQLLSEAEIGATTSPHAPDALLLDKPVGVEMLPDFDAGTVSVQDAAAQLAAPLLDCQAGETVLDACAAPGGKTSHLLERSANLQVIALDNDQGRMARVQENLERLQLEALCISSDASAPDAWWDGDAFDRILLDAPCSATGVIRRHPDIKWLRREEDIAALAERQLGMLNALWPLLKPGGTLLYATCSTLRAEGDEVVAAFLEAATDANNPAIKAAWGEGTDHGRRIACGSDDMDGFYYALLTKTNAATSEAED